MSGGEFDYQQYHLNEIADQIERIIAKNDSTEKNEYGYEIGNHFSKETIEKFQETIITLRRGAIMAQRVDWLISADDSEDSFHKRWKEELGTT